MNTYVPSLMPLSARTCFWAVVTLPHLLRDNLLLLGCLSVAVSSQVFRLSGILDSGLKET